MKIDYYSQGDILELVLSEKRVVREVSVRLECEC